MVIALPAHCVHQSRSELDLMLELPEYRANFEIRLILLKKRLEECDAPVRISAPAAAAGSTSRSLRRCVSTTSPTDRPGCSLGRQRDSKVTTVLRRA